VTHALAFVLTAGLGAVLLMPQRLTPLEAAAAPVVQIALEPEPSPPSPSPPVPEPPAPQPPKVPHPTMHRDVQLPDPLPLMAAEVSPPAEMQLPDPAPAAAVEAPSPKGAVPADLESQYAAALRTNIDSRTAPPTSAEYRLLKPHGEVRVNFTLERSGMLVDSALARSSGSALLDRHALEIVRAGRYLPFPNEAFRGESRHSFLITLEFHS